MGLELWKRFRARGRCRGVMSCSWLLQSLKARRVGGEAAQAQECGVPGVSGKGKSQVPFQVRGCQGEAMPGACKRELGFRWMQSFRGLEAKLKLGPGTLTAEYGERKPEQEGPGACLHGSRAS